MSRKLFITIVFCLSFYFTNAQSQFAAVPLKPKNITGVCFGTMTDVNRGFLCGNTWFFGTYNARKFQLHSFDGSLYKKYPPFIVDSLKLNRIIQFRDTILLVGNFYNPMDIQNQESMMILRGNSWDTLAGPELSQTYSSAVVNNKLYILTGFSSTSLYEMNHWGSLKLITSFTGGGLAPNLLARNKNSELIVMGGSGTFIYRWRNGDWDTLSNSSQNTGWHNVLQGDTCIYMYNPITSQLVKLGMEFKLKNLATISYMNINNGTKGMALLGNKLLIGSVKTYDINTAAIDTSIGLDFLEGIHYGSGIVYGIDVSSNNNITKVYEITAGAHVYGRMFFDKNGNCNRDTGEEVFNNLAAYAINASDTVHFYCDDTGAFSTIVAPGNSSFRLAEPYATASGSLCGIPTDTLLTAGRTVRYDIPFVLQSGKHDLGVKLAGHTGFRARQGFKETYSLICKNYGTVNDSFKISVKYPDTLNFVSSDNAPLSHANRELVFVVNGLSAKSEKTIKLVFEVPTSRNIGSTLIYQCALEAFLDQDTNNNKYILTQKVVSAYDPNSKESLPQGVVYDPVSLIKYQINFQNLGTDTAYRILVVDSFMPNFPLERLQMTGASHPYNLVVRPGNVLIWEFNNILLPPTRENVEKSSGFITFEAPLREPTRKGQVISNRAHIYFDYQRGVITDWDHVQHSEWGLAMKQLHTQPNTLTVFPNPSSGKLHIQSSVVFRECQLFNAMGAVVRTAGNQTNGCEMDIQDLLPGVYVLRVPDLGQSVQIIRN